MAMPNIPVTWRNQFNVNTTTTGAQFDPEITQLANGNILVCWTTSDAGGLGSPIGNEVFGQIFDPLGNKVGTELRLNNASTPEDEQNAQVAALPGGGFVVVYHDVDNPFNGGASNIRLEEYDANGVAVSDDPLVVNDTGLPNDPDYQNPRVAVSSATSVLVVYEEITAGVSTIRGKIYDTTTNTYGAQISLIAFAGGDTNPDVTALTNGNYVITANIGGADTAIGYRIITSTGANILGATRVTGTDTNTENDREASVTALTGGGFVIVWTNTDALDTDIVYRIYNSAGVQVGQGLITNGSDSNNSNEPVVAGLADGSFIIVYDNDEANGGVAAHIAASGVQLGEFTFTTTSFTTPVVTDLGDGRFAVAWSDSIGELSMEILDTRDTPNTPGVYTPDQWVVGTIGDDVFTPNSNAEFTHGWDGNDTITESGGTREYYGDDGNDTFNVVSAINADKHDGGIGNDTIDWSVSSATGATFNLVLGTATQGAATEQMLNFENLVGTNNADIIIGTSGANVLTGGGGDDVVVGGADNDSLVGGIGNDVLFGDAGNDTLDGGADTNYLYGGTGSNSMAGGSGLDIFVAEGSIDLMTGGDGTNYYYRGAAGFAAMTGGTGQDIYVGGAFASNDTFQGFGGDDYAEGGDGDDLMEGGANNDILLGGNGIDTLDGGSGSNYLYMDGGNDQARVVASGGVQLLVGFDAGGVNDSVRLLSSTLTSFANFQTLVTNLGNIVGGNLLQNTGVGAILTLNLGTGSQTDIWFLGTLAGGITAADITFV
jgi:hypothetical protein